MKRSPMPARAESMRRTAIKRTAAKPSRPRNTGPRQQVRGVAKSACIGCPYNGNSRWRQLRDQRPDEWADAVDLDRQFRTASGLNSERFLHESRVPLDQAPIDHVTASEWAGRQTDIFDHLEDGDPDGCSPYGCRSGTAVPVHASTDTGVSVTPQPDGGPQ